jgi:hypothetical protein
VDAEDANIPLHQGIDDLCAERLGEQADPNLIIPCAWRPSASCGRKRA